MDAIKGLFFTFGFMTLILVGLTVWPQLQGVPIEHKLSHIANSSMQYIQQILSPITDLLYRYVF